MIKPFFRACARASSVVRTGISFIAHYTNFSLVSLTLRLEMDQAEEFQIKSELVGKYRDLEEEVIPGAIDICLPKTDKK